MNISLDGHLSSLLWVERPVAWTSWNLEATAVCWCETCVYHGIFTVQTFNNMWQEVRSAIIHPVSASIINNGLTVVTSSLSLAWSLWNWVILEYEEPYYPTVRPCAPSFLRRYFDDAKTRFHKDNLRHLSWFLDTGFNVTAGTSYHSLHLEASAVLFQETLI